MQAFNWTDFYAITKNRPPWPRLARAVDLQKHGGEALDLGCGAGRDTHYLIEHGFRVTAVDQEAASLELLSDLLTDRLHRVQCLFEMFQFGHYDLINAHFSLPFIEREHFPLVFDRLKAALKPGAIFVGQFFGRNDTWNVPGTHMTFCTRQQALAYLEGLELLEFEEEEEDGTTANGASKHWHIYHSMVRKL